MKVFFLFFFSKIKCFFYIHLKYTHQQAITQQHFKKKFFQAAFFISLNSIHDTIAVS